MNFFKNFVFFSFIVFSLSLKSFLFSNEEKIQVVEKITLEHVENILKLIPEQDLCDIRELFNLIVRTNNFGYPLFGYKPMSLSADVFITPPYITLSRLRSGSVFWRWWEVWNKYQHLFPSKNFLLIKNISQTDSNLGEVILINKKLFLKTIAQYLTTFRKILGSECTPKKLLKEIEEGKPFASVIKNNEILWGILLGYGENNAKNFNRRSYLESFPSLRDVPKKYISNTHDSLESELNFLEEQLKVVKIKPSNIPFVIGPVGFVGNLSSQETKSLIRKYSLAGAHLNRVYAKGNLLEITLSKFISD